MQFQKKDPRATIVTKFGEMKIRFYPDDAPRHVENFVNLAKMGFFDGTTFHRVVPDFVIQGGCPEGSGRGGPGYKFADEPVIAEYTLGAVAMANSGPNTNGSQFFIVTAEACPWLDGMHTVFGRVTSGMDVVDAISQVETDMQDRPLAPVTRMRMLATCAGRPWLASKTPAPRRGSASAEKRPGAQQGAEHGESQTREEESPGLRQ